MLDKDIKVNSEQLASFQSLNAQGIKNFFTFDNNKWRGMGLSKERSIEKYEKIFSNLNINHKIFLYLGAEQNNNVQIIDEDNLKIYQLFNKSDYKTENLQPIVIPGDGIITKLTIPIVVTPADCSVLCFVGIDKKDNKKFVIFLHSGVYGTMLKIYSRALKIAHTFYDFDNNDLDVFIYPSVGKEYYIKLKTDDYRGHLVQDPEWKDFILDKGDSFGIDIENKIISDLKSYGIKKIYSTGIEVYQANVDGKLFSFTYSKEKKIDSNNFAVGVCIASS
jgi:copper oxidase (laccase) domain-containing protein